MKIFNEKLRAIAKMEVELDNIRVSVRKIKKLFSEHFSSKGDFNVFWERNPKYHDILMKKIDSLTKNVWDLESPVTNSDSDLQAIRMLLEELPPFAEKRANVVNESLQEEVTLLNSLSSSLQKAEESFKESLRINHRYANFSRSSNYNKNRSHLSFFKMTFIEKMEDGLDVNLWRIKDSFQMAQNQILEIQKFLRKGRNET